MKKGQITKKVQKVMNDLDSNNFKLREKQLLEKMEDAQQGMQVNCGTDHYQNFWDDFCKAESELKRLRESQSKSKEYRK